MTPEYLAAILARAEAAMVGPWTIHEARSGIHSQWEHELPERSTAINAPHPLFALGQTVAATPPMYDSEAEFIAHARTDIPALVAEVRRLDAALAAARALCGEAADELAQCRGDNAESDAAISGVESRLRAEAAKGGEVRGG